MDEAKLLELLVRLGYISRDKALEAQAKKERDEGYNKHTPKARLYR